MSNPGLLWQIANIPWPLLLIIIQCGIIMASQFKSHVIYIPDIYICSDSIAHCVLYALVHDPYGRLLKWAPKDAMRKRGFRSLWGCGSPNPNQIRDYVASPHVFVIKSICSTLIITLTHFSSCYVISWLNKPSSLNTV